MKKLIALISILFLTTTQAITINVEKDKNEQKNLPQYFRDISPKIKLNIAIDSAVQRKILQTGSFFRPEENVPAIMFWEVVLQDAGIKLESREFSKILEKAVEEELISLTVAQNLQFDTPVTKLRVIKTLIKTKKLLPPRRISQEFRGIYPFIELVDSEELPYIETAYASGILSLGDLKGFNPGEEVSRREFITWIYNYFDHGKRQSKVSADKTFRWNKRNFRYHSGLKSRFSAQKKKTKIPQKNLKKENLTIKILDNVDLEKISLQKKNPFPGTETLDEIYNEIISQYEFIDELTAEKKQEIIDKSLSALVKGLGDRYSTYVKPTKSEKFKDGLDGEFEGIGAYVEMVDDKFTIIAPIGGSPAEEAGLITGDIVIKVDDTDTKGLSIREIVDLIMGPAGTRVKLKILRNNTSRDFEIIRDKIIEPAVVLKWVRSVPVIKINQFNHSTIVLLREKLEEVMLKKNRGIVFDLRNNPGGYLDSAIEVGSLFLKKGETIFHMEERGKNKTFEAKGNGILSDVKNIVVLQNGGSASASEILIGMLQDYKKARIIGTKSLGKGTVQSVKNLENGGLLKLTVAKWLTPNKRWIHEKGIIPDMEVESSTIEEKKNKKDRQLEAAIWEILK
jgi:carboxyl-terminal processing protease